MIPQIERVGPDRRRVVTRLSTSLGGALISFLFSSPAYSLHRARA